MATEDKRMQQLRATAAEWGTNNPVMLDGEIGVVSDTNQIKIGDGTSAFNSLPYVGGSSTNFLIEWQDGTDVTASVSTINNFTYTAGALVVMVNGIIQERTVDYNETGGNTVTWVEDPVSTDDITFFQYEVVDTGLDIPAVSENESEANILQNGPLLWYKMAEQSGTAMSDYQGNKNGTYSSGASINALGVNTFVSNNRSVDFSSGTDAKATVIFDFDDAGSQTDQSMKAINDRTSSFSVSCWAFYADSSAADDDEPIIRFQDLDIYIDSSDNAINATGDGSTTLSEIGKLAFSNVKLEQNKTFANITFVFEKLTSSTGNWYLYVNGMPVDYIMGDSYSEEANTGLQTFYIADAAGQSDDPFHGSVTSVQVYDKKLELTEVLDQYFYDTNNALPTPPTPSLTNYDNAIIAQSPALWYRMDEDSGNMMIDYEDARHGVYDEMTGVVYGDTGVGTQVSSNKAINFDGSTTGNAMACFDYSKVSGIDKIMKDITQGATDFTFNFWVSRISATGSDEYIILADTTEISIAIKSDGTVECIIGSMTASSSGSITAASGFHMVSFTYEDLGATAATKVYIDGVEDGDWSGTKSGLGSHTGTSILQILGALNANVSMTSVSVFNSLLSAGTILDIYNKGTA